MSGPTVNQQNNSGDPKESSLNVLWQDAISCCGSSASFNHSISDHSMPCVGMEFFVVLAPALENAGEWDQAPTARAAGI